MGYIDDDEANPYAAPKEMSVPLYEVGFTEYASFWARLAAWFIDWLLVSVVNFGAGMVVGVVGQAAQVEPPAVRVLAAVVGVVIGYGYYAGMISSESQATLGKMALGIKVTGLNGGRISFSHALGRELAKILSTLTCGIGYMMAAFTERRQALHDMIAGTLVVKSG